MFSCDGLQLSSGRINRKNMSKIQKTKKDNNDSDTYLFYFFGANIKIK